MMRPLILTLVGLLVVGCKSQSPTSNPFFGRTTIPPPPTGAATGQPCNTYQAPPVAQVPPQSPGAISPPLVQMPSQPPAVSSTAPAPAASSPLPGFQPSPPAATTPPPTSPPATAPSYSSPRPTSTGGSLPPLPSATPSAVPPAVPPAGASTPYVPPGGTFNYRGASSQDSTPLVPTQPSSGTALPSVVGVAASRTVTPSDDRMPRPVELRQRRRGRGKTDHSDHPTAAKRGWIGSDHRHRRSAQGQ